MTGLTLLRIGFGSQSVAVANPGQSMVFWLARMTIKTRRIFVTHLTAVWLSSIGHAVLLFIVAGMIGRARSHSMTHYTIFCSVFAVVTLQAILHPGFNHMPIKVFPTGDSRVTAAAFNFLMLQVRKNKTLFKPIAKSLGWRWFFKVA